MRHVVIGGGIGGVCCVEELCRLVPQDVVTLVTASPALKGVSGVVRLSKYVEEFKVVERRAESMVRRNLRIVRGRVVGLDLAARTVSLAVTHQGPTTQQQQQQQRQQQQQQSGTEEAEELLPYDTLCICAGARPKVLAHHDRVVTLRDTESMQDFAHRLAGSRRVVVVGNGGIALELVGSVRGVEVIWVIRHSHIADAFFDVDAAEFLLGEMQWRQEQEKAQQEQEQADGGVQTQDRDKSQKSMTRQQQQQQQQQEEVWQQHGAPDQRQQKAQGRQELGAALGPKWTEALPKGPPANVKLERSAQVLGVSSTRAEAVAAFRAQAAGSSCSSGPRVDGSVCTSSTSSSAGNADEQEAWPVWLALAGPAGAHVLGADLVVSAIGVEPATEWLPACLERAPDGGLLVGADLRTSDPHVFAAGDCCTLRPEQQAPNFFQMRLWTQARLMGMWAAHNMTGRADDSGLSMAFELFTHATRFLGKKVVLLGLYNGQKLQHEPPGDISLYSRTLGEGGPGSTFVRVLLLRGRLQGAVLIGETELEEALENLILDGLDLGGVGPALLDPGIQLDHVFD